MKSLRSILMLLAALGCGSSAHGVELKVLSSWDNTYPAVPMWVAPFMKNVEAASKGDIKFTLNGPETVPPFEQLQPVGAGVFHLLFSNSAYHYGITPYLVAADGVKGDSKKWRESGLYDLIDRHYQRFGVKVLFLARTSVNRGYQIFTRAPVSTNGDLAGRKIRGTQLYGPVIAALKASPVVLPPSEIYTSLEKGVIDGAAWPTIGVADARWYEVAKYLVRPTFGVSTHFMFINLETWNRLTEPQKAVMTAEAIGIETTAPSDWENLAIKEEGDLLSKGMQISEMGAPPRVKIIDGYGEGLWDLVKSKDPHAVDELRAFAIKNNM
jgi:TRAP-type transport system periplasmic protein